MKRSTCTLLAALLLLAGTAGCEDVSDIRNSGSEAHADTAATPPESQTAAQPAAAGRTIQIRPGDSLRIVAVSPAGRGPAGRTRDASRNRAPSAADTARSRAQTSAPDTATAQPGTTRSLAPAPRSAPQQQP